MNKKKIIKSKTDFKEFSEKCQYLDISPCDLDCDYYKYHKECDGNYLRRCTNDDYIPNIFGPKCECKIDFCSYFKDVDFIEDVDIIIKDKKINLLPILKNLDKIEIDRIIDINTNFHTSYMFLRCSWCNKNIVNDDMYYSYHFKGECNPLVLHSNCHREVFNLFLNMIKKGK